MSLASTLALMILPAAIRKRPKPDPIEDLHRVLDELDLKREAERELRSDVAALAATLQQAWRRIDELTQEMDGLRRHLSLSKNPDPVAERQFEQFYAMQNAHPYLCNCVPARHDLLTRGQADQG
jgi:hypothetical protein